MGPLFENRLLQARVEMVLVGKKSKYLRKLMATWTVLGLSVKIANLMTPTCDLKARLPGSKKKTPWLVDRVARLEGRHRDWTGLWSLSL